MLPKTELDALHLKMDIANRIAAAMERKGMTRTQLAHAVGVSKAMVTKVLSGDENLSLESISKYLGALNCRFDSVVVPDATDEWKVKRILNSIEEAFWNDSENWVEGIESSVSDFVVVTGESEPTLMAIPSSDQYIAVPA
jgi:transcriptional regulator with XRE-family HTH domain